jgi:hypothetical protein
MERNGTVLVSIVTINLTVICVFAFSVVIARLRRVYVQAKFLGLAQKPIMLRCRAKLKVSNLGTTDRGRGMVTLRSVILATPFSSKGTAIG